LRFLNSTGQAHIIEFGLVDYQDCEFVQEEFIFLFPREFLKQESNSVNVLFGQLGEHVAHELLDD